LEAWRKAWADLVNEEFRKRGIDANIDHRSYADQGLQLIPQIHEGPHVRKMEAKGIITEKGELNRWIREINKEIVALSKGLKEIMANISELMKIIAEKEAEAQKPELVDYINAYFDKRNAVANSYSYGRNKAKISNLKLHSRVVNYLIANDVRTLDAFKAHVSDKQDELYKLNASMKKKSARINELKDLIRYGEWYKEAQPVIREICSIKSAKRKEKIKGENDSMLQRYHIAKRILTEKKISKLDFTAWQEEIDRFQNSYNEEYATYKELSAEIKTMRDINIYIDGAIRGNHTKKREEFVR
jgi:hypothetical protein